jgi:membrane protein DedA with SNARE-associated domain
MPKKRRVRKVKRKVPRSKKETSRLHSIKHSLITLLIFALAALGLWVLLLMLKYFLGFSLFSWFSELPVIYPIAAYIATQVTRRSFEGIVYSFAFSSLFFVPTPLELLFMGFLSTVRTQTTIIVPAFIGLLIGQHANFFLGRFFRRFAKRFIKKSTRDQVAERLREHGAIAIFFINLLPLPYPITNFLAGSLKYPYKKWLLFVSLAIAIKLVFLAWLVAMLF